MGKILISSDVMTDIADAVRSMSGATGKLTGTEIAEQVKSMIGQLRLDVIADGYSSLRTYTVGDLVISQNKLYACISTISVPEDFDPTHWRETTISNEFKIGSADDKYY